jgi:hypothetical protein
MRFRNEAERSERAMTGLRFFIFYSGYSFRPLSTTPVAPMDVTP